MTTKISGGKDRRGKVIMGEISYGFLDGLRYKQLCWCGWSWKNI